MYRNPYKPLKTDFSNGHSGGSGRFAGFRDSAYRLALIFELERLAKLEESLFCLFLYSF
tara:strand:+ start:96 stop:272 length:177 start_codon:yes stop_codon:yes gene_type:complete